jgi:hypothetical protein
VRGRSSNRERKRKGLLCGVGGREIENG